MTIDKIISFDNYTFAEVKTLYDAIPQDYWSVVVSALPTDLQHALDTYDSLHDDEDLCE